MIRRESVTLPSYLTAYALSRIVSLDNPPVMEPQP